jgi:phosphoribosylanthranilate isomerase
MHLENVSITGADDEISISELNRLYEEYPFVEWAILYMPEKESEPRFPKTSWINDFKNNYIGSATAMHLCGSALLKFIEGDKKTLNIMKGFKRIQLNLIFGNVIDQYKNGFDDILKALKDIPNHAILFDESAGRGVAPSSWSRPLDDHVCGYAGGISPDNIRTVLENLQTVVDDKPFWVDMETGVRTNDQFDLEKVRKVLSISKEFI